MALDLIELVVQGLVTLLFAFVGSYLMWKIAGPKVVIKALQERMGPILIEWFMRPSIKTGKKKVVTDEEGESNEVDEILSPLELIMKQAGELVYQKFMGKVGGDVRKKQAVQGDIIAGLAKPDSPLGGLLNSVNPALLNRALKDGDYLPLIMEQFGPTIIKYFEGRINKVGTNLQAGAGSGL